MEKGLKDYWAKVRSHPDFAKQARGDFIKIPPEPRPEEKALALLRGALNGNAALAPIIGALEKIISDAASKKDA